MNTEDKIKELEQKVAELKEQYAKEQEAKDKRWKPKSMEDRHYFAINGEYEYWIPYSGMAKPNKLPEGCEYLCAGWWLPEYDGVGMWSYVVRRWPKTSYTGE